MFEFLGNTSIGCMRWASGNLPLKRFSLQRETRAEAARSDRRRYLFFLYRLWHEHHPPWVFADETTYGRESGVPALGLRLEPDRALSG